MTVYDLPSRRHVVHKREEIRCNCLVRLVAANASSSLYRLLFWTTDSSTTPLLRSRVGYCRSEGFTPVTQNDLHKGYSLLGSSLFRVEIFLQHGDSNGHGRAMHTILSGVQ